MMAVTKDAIAHFDWSSFILQELCEEIQEFKKDSQKSKRKKSKTVGGCLYFLMTDEIVKRRVLVVKRSKKGLLLHVKPRQPLPQSSLPPLPQASVPPSTSFDPDTMLTHPPTTSEESDDDDEDGHDIEEGDDMDEGDQPEDIIDVEEIPQHGEETPHVDGGLGGEQERKSKGKRTYVEKDTLFEMCTKSVSEDEVTEEFVDIHHYFPTREELQCLHPRQWINNKLMTMVAKTLVADQLENGGVVHRHIFTADLMSKMISAKRKWTIQSNVRKFFLNMLETTLENPTQLATKKKAKKKTKLDKAKELMANKVPFRRMGSS
ncbi:hypothetical protein K1719_009417 [Acacia pycnantha]|nr:hypothetical protein K1719_009417 [Acacia pycnantha]